MDTGRIFVEKATNHVYDEKLKVTKKYMYDEEKEKKLKSLEKIFENIENKDEEEMASMIISYTSVYKDLENVLMDVDEEKINYMESLGILSQVGEYLIEQFLKLKNNMSTDSIQNE